MLHLTHLLDCNLWSVMNVVKPQDMSHTAATVISMHVISVKFYFLSCSGIWSYPVLDVISIYAYLQMSQCFEHLIQYFWDTAASYHAGYVMACYLLFNEFFNGYTKQKWL